MKFSIQKDKVPLPHIDVSHVGEYYVCLLVYKWLLCNIS